MIRSVWKMPFIFNKAYKNLKLNNEHKFLAKNSVVTPRIVDKVLNIYNGKTFMKIIINENMVGHKLGEFIITRKYGRYKSKKKNIKKKKN